MTNLRDLENLMTKDVASLDPKASVASAARLMRDRNVGCIPICEDDQPIGVLTDRDIVLRVVAQRLDAESTPVAEVMTPHAVTITAVDDLYEAADKMSKRQVRRLLVVDDDGRLEGIFTLADLAVTCPVKGLVGEVMEHVSEPSRFATEISTRSRRRDQR
jgi:CBS domain-containing protein